MQGLVTAENSCNNVLTAGSKGISTAVTSVPSASNLEAAAASAAVRSHHHHGQNLEKTTTTLVEGGPSDGGINTEGGAQTLHQPLAINGSVETSAPNLGVGVAGGIQRRVVVVGNTAHLVTIHPAPAHQNTLDKDVEGETTISLSSPSSHSPLIQMGAGRLGVGGVADGTQLSVVGGRLMATTNNTAQHIPNNDEREGEEASGGEGEYDGGNSGGGAMVNGSSELTVSTANLVVSSHLVDLRVKPKNTTGVQLSCQQADNIILTSDRPTTPSQHDTADIKPDSGTLAATTIAITGSHQPNSVATPPTNQEQTMIDTSDFRMSSEPTYQTLASAAANGRMTPPGYLAAPQGHYATLTPLQPMTPLPPISSLQMGEKFGYPVTTTPNVSGSFTVMQNNSLAQISIPSPYYDSKLVSMGMSPPHFHQNHMGLHSMQHSPTLSPTPYTSHNGLHSPHKTISPIPYEYRSSLDPQSPHDLSPTSGDNERSPTSDTAVSAPTYSSPSIYTTSTALTTSNNPSLNGMASLSPHNISPHHSPSLPSHHLAVSQRDLSPPSPPHHHQSLPHPSPILPPTTILHHPMSLHQSQVQHQAAMKSPNSTTSSSGELEEINTKELAQRISAELKRYSIPQAIFAQRVLCRSQGTLSDLLRNPKPWSKLKSGRETFRRMFKWLQEPEFQRMSSLRLAGKYISLIL